MKTEVKTAKQISIIDDTKTTYYVIIGEGEAKTVINVGEKTYEKVNNTINKKEDIKNMK